jgi:histidine triad (HIT) family protein
MEHVDYNCIFCAIAAERVPASVIYENADAVAFMDIRPITEGHVLVIPRKHCRNLLDFDDSCARGVMHAARVVARALRVALNADGMNLFQSSERAAGQDVFHFHFHLVPRFQGDGLMSRWHARSHPTHDELEAVAARIRAHIKGE